MKKPLLLLFSFMLALQAGSAQNYSSTGYNRPYDRGYIYLKNGDILKAKYQYSTSLDKILLVTGNDTFILNADEIEKITKTKPEAKPDNKAYEPYVYVPRRYFNFTELGVLAGSPENTLKNPLIVNTSFNYVFDRCFSAGMGLGLEFYGETYLPVTANVMYRMPTPNRVFPFILLQGGYNLPLNGTRMTTYQIAPSYLDYRSFYPYYNQEELDTRGGFLINPAVGFIYQISDGFGLGLSLGYRYHLLNYVSATDYKLQVAYNRLSIKIGLIFN